MGMREVVLAALVGALIVIAAVAVPALALESPGFHAVVYPVALALFVPYAWLTLPAVLKEGHEMTALYALFVSMAIATVWAIGELSGRSIGRMRLIVLEGALVSVMALSFASVLISLGVTNTLILSSPLAVAAMIYIVAALVGIVPPEGVEAGISDNAATASIPSNIEVETIISRDEEKEQTQTPPSVEIYENLPTICIKNAEEETPSIPAIVVPEEAGEEPVPAINCEAEAPATAEEAAITEEPLIIAEEEGPAPVVIEEEPIPAEPAIIAEKEAIPAETVAIIEEETIPAESAPAEEISIEEPVEEVLIEEELAIIEPEVIAEASLAEEIAEPAIVEEEEIIPVEEDEPVLVEEAEPAIIEEEPAPIAAIEEDVIQIPRPPAITVSSRLSVPTAPMLTNKAKLEEPRVPSAPSLSNTAELVEEAVVNDASGLFSGLSAEEADFWASFYVAGEDELQFEDGEYYLGLYVNDTYMGAITSYVKNNEASVSSSELLAYVSEYLTDAAIDRLFSEKAAMVSLQWLRDNGVLADFVGDEYNIYLTFSTDDMPVQILSISDTRGFRRTVRPIADAIELDPAVFVLRSRYTFDTSFMIYPFNYFKNSLRFRFSASNEAILYDIHFLFDYDFDFGLDYFDFNLSSYRFYTDIGDDGLRISWGNINTELLSNNGTSIGVRIEKDSSFASSSVKRKSQIERYITVEKESEVTILNEGREIFKRTLQKGNYRLTDFILYSGVNRIEIVIKPLDGSPEIRYEMNVNYSSSLLAPGELYFSFAAATKRQIVSSSSHFYGTGFRIPWLNGTSLEYDFRNVTLSGSLDAGLTQSLTLNTEIAVQNRAYRESGWNPAGRISVAMTHANILGTTRYNLTVSEYADEGVWTYPDIYARIGHQITTGMPSLSSITLGLSYDLNSDLEHDVDASLSLSGRFSIFNWNASVSGGYDNGDIPWSASASLSLSPKRNMRLSVSARISATNLETPRITGRIYFSWLIGNGVSTNASLSGSDFTAAFSAYDDKNSFYTSVSGSPLLSPKDYDAMASYSYRGKYIGVSADVNAYDFISSSRRFYGSLSLNTSSVFADGLLAFANTIPSNFLLIHQDSRLSDNEISIGVPSSSTTTVLKKEIGGTALYDGVRSGSYLSIYSTPEDSFGSTAAYNVHVPSSGDGFVYRIKAEELYSVSGVVEIDDFIWNNASSPIYSVIVDEAGQETLNATENYLFTDSDGRFVVSGLSAGEYAFDVEINGSWILVRFSVENKPDKLSYVQLLGLPEETKQEGMSSVYSACYEMTNEEILSGSDFWNFLYPEAANE